jgi:hypothetical protein
MNQPIRVRISLTGLPFKACQNFEVGKPCLISELEVGTLFFEVSTGLDNVCMVCDPSDSEATGLINTGYSYKQMSCEYEFEPGDYERLGAVLIPAGSAHTMAFPLHEVKLDAN